MNMKGILGLILVAGTFGAFTLWRHWQAFEGDQFPLPYKIARKTSTTEAFIQPQAPVLIIGDHMAQRLGLFKENLSLALSTGLDDPLKIEVLASETAGLHRTLESLKKLEKWPVVIVYQGGTKEFYEERISVKDFAILKKNLQSEKDPTKKSLMMLFPKLTRFYFSPLKPIELAETIPASAATIEEKSQLERLEMMLTLYEIELREMVRLARQNKTTLLLTTTPLNLGLPPGKVCLWARSPKSDQEMQELQKTFQEGNFKKAYELAKTFTTLHPARADGFHLLSQASLQLGYHDESETVAQQALALDCDFSRGSPLFNAIIREVAKTEHVALFDMAAFIEKDWGKNTLFFDEWYLQNHYYEKSIAELAAALKLILNL